MEDKLSGATARFEQLVKDQLARVERMKAQKDFIDYKTLDPIIIGVCGGDGIGPVITGEARRVLEYLLADEVGPVAYTHLSSGQGRFL